MPTIRVHVPEADLELIKRAAVYRLTTVQALMVSAAEDRARQILAERKHIKAVK